MVISHRAIGDAANVLVLVLAAAYAVATVGHGAGLWHLAKFGKNWSADGFCLSFKDTKYYHTHLLCFYGDTVFAVLTWALTRHTSSRPELRVVEDNIASCFFHGLAHAAVWYQGAKEGDGEPTMIKGILGYALFYVFWASFLLGVPTPFKKRGNLAQALVHAVVSVDVIPPFFIFTYVNTVLFFNINIARLVDGVEGEHDLFYTLQSTLISIPIMLATYAEPLLCDAWLVNWGGHILFDYTIPATCLLYFAVASRLPPRSSSSSSKGE